MKDNIAHITRWITYILIGIVAILGILFYTNNLSEDTFITASKWLLILGVAVMVISPVYTFIVHPKNLVKLLISLGLFVVVIVISYSIAGNTYTDLQLESLKTDADTSKLVGMGLNVTYIAFGLAIIAAIYASIVKAFK